jgi:ribosome-binding protein aMBF1 (putative translation factor)
MICENCGHEAKEKIIIEGIEINLCRPCSNAVNRGLISETTLKYMHKVFINKKENSL